MSYTGTIKSSVTAATARHELTVINFQRSSGVAAAAAASGLQAPVSWASGAIERD